MSKKLTKKQIKEIAILHTASLLSNADSHMFLHNHTDEEDEAKVVEAIIAIGLKIQGNRPLLNTTDEIIDYVLKHKQI